MGAAVNLPARGDLGGLAGHRGEQPLVVTVRITAAGTAEVFQGLNRIHTFDQPTDLALAGFLVMSPDQGVHEHGPFRLWNRVLTDDEVAEAVGEVEAQIGAQETAAGLPAPALPGLSLGIFADSISDYSFGTEVWVGRLPNRPALTGVNHARSGARLRDTTDVGVSVSTQIAGSKLVGQRLPFPERPRTLALIWAGTNDLNANRSATNDPLAAGDKLRLCVLDARARGYDEVAVVTMLPRALGTLAPMTQAEYDAWRNTYNTFVRTGTGADYVWDAGALQAMQDTSFPTYNDGLHPGRVGSQILADDLARWLDATGLLATRTVLSATPQSSLPALAEASFALSAPRPNPASGRTTVVLTLDRPQHVRAVLVDALGRTVAVLHDAEAAGVVSLSVDAGGLAPGVYVVHVAGAAATETRRITVVR